MKVTLDDGTRFILRVTGESPLFIRGIEVDAEGDEVVPRGAHQRLRIIDRGRIARTAEMRMNPKYATLETVSRSSKATQQKTLAQLDADIAEVIGTWRPG